MKEENRDIREWRMWAHEYSYAFMHMGSFNYVRHHLLSEPIVEVIVRVDPAGRYWGWLPTPEEEGDDRAPVPTMIWPSEVQYKMCFPYGPEAEEQKGRGRTLRFSIEKVEGGIK